MSIFAVRADSRSKQNLTNINEHDKEIEKINDKLNSLSENAVRQETKLDSIKDLVTEVRLDIKKLISKGEG